HTTLDAIRDIVRRRPFILADIEKIVVHGSQVTVDHVGWPYRPEGLTAAQLNLPFCVATLLIKGNVFVDQFKPEAVTDERRIAISRKSRSSTIPPSRRSARHSGTRCASRSISTMTPSRARRGRRRAAANNRSRRRTGSSPNSASSRVQQ